MNAFFDFLKVAAIGFFALVAVFLVLLALPKSRLRSVVMEIVGWFTATAATASVISPIDLIPDIFVGVGWIDDIVAIFVGLCSVGFAIAQRHERAKLAAAEREVGRLRG